MSLPVAKEYCWVSPPPAMLSSVRIHEHSMVGAPALLSELPPLPIVALTPIPLTVLFCGPWAKALPMLKLAIVAAAMSMVAPLAHGLLGALSCIGSSCSCATGQADEAPARRGT